MPDSELEQSTLVTTHARGLTASSPAPLRSRAITAANSNRALAMEVSSICKQCSVEAPQNEFRFCHSCGISVHPLCIAPLIFATGSCVRGDSCVFLPLSAERTKKRAHLDLSKSSFLEDSVVIPEPIVFADFCKDLNDESKIVDFASA